MTAQTVINQCLNAGVSLSLRGGKLIASPSSMVTPEIAESIRRHKPDILSLLAAADEQDRNTWNTWNTEKNNIPIENMETTDPWQRFDELFRPDPTLPPTDMAAFRQCCWCCIHFVPDDVGDGTGLGDCLVWQDCGHNARRTRWPGQWCNHWTAQDSEN